MGSSGNGTACRICKGVRYEGRSMPVIVDFCVFKRRLENGEAINDQTREVPGLQNL